MVSTAKMEVSFNPFLYRIDFGLSNFFFVTNDRIAMVISLLIIAERIIEKIIAGISKIPWGTFPVSYNLLYRPLYFNQQK